MYITINYYKLYIIMKIKITFITRFLCVVFTILGVGIFFTSLVLLYVFLSDLEMTDKYKLVRLSKNNFFSICKYTSCDDYIEYKKFIFNFGLILLFWLQHIIMANSTFKNVMNSFCSYGVYERGLYVISKIII